MATHRGDELAAARAKRAERQAARDAAKQERLAGQQHYLRYLARKVKTRAQLERALKTVPDTIMRAEIRKLVLPLCTFTE